LWVSGASVIGGAAIVGAGDVDTADVVVAVVLSIEVSVATGPQADSDAMTPDPHGGLLDPRPIG
jgi:hypothetical protein